MKILFVASEAGPYFKSGGLADVARSLPDALMRDGHDVRICHPYYGLMADQPIHVSETVALGIPWPGNGQVKLHLHEPANAAPAVLVEHASFANVLEPYIAPIDPLAVGERFALFSRAALHYAERWGADVIHLNDWQTGLLPLYALIDDIRIATVFSIHNLPYQGNFDPEIMPRIGVPSHFFRTENGVEFFNEVSFIKAGTSFADRVTTVSPTYAREIQTPEFGAGLDGLLRFRARSLHGILNGLDVETWNPMTDPAIPQQYGVRSLEMKSVNSDVLRREMRILGDGPIFASVTRLAHQKGMDILLAALPQLLERGASFVLLGDGDVEGERAFSRAAAAFPGRVAAFFRFDDRLARAIYAGADFFVMPSRYEPCGLGQMIAQRYGTVPIVRRTGGLVDTVADGETGFAFDQATPQALLEATDRALAVYSKKREWPRMQRRCMRLDHSWSRSAEQYTAVYRAAIGPVLG